MATKDTVIIIAVCASVAGTVVLYLSFRIYKHYTATSNPLPPPQPLAHHREQQIAKFENSIPRTHTWYQQNHLSAPRPFGANPSSASLLIKSSPSPSAEDHSPSDYVQPLPRPNPSFHTRPISTTSSFNSSETGHAPSLFTSTSTGPSTPPTPPSEQPIPRHARSSPGPSSRRPRPLSVASSHSTIHSKTSRHTLRGVPHGPHSQIQIVLPAPLAPDSPNPSSTDLLSQRPVSRYDGGGFDRSSVVDKWVSTGDLANLASMNPPRRSTTPTQSQQELSSYATSGPYPSLPPVPRVPSIYKDVSVTDLGELGNPAPYGPRRTPKNMSMSVG